MHPRVRRSRRTGLLRALEVALNTAFALAAFGLLAGGTARAQLQRSTGPALLPIVSTAAPDGAYALETSPAALAYVPSWELAYAHAEAGNDQRLADRGDALYGAYRLPFGLAIGAHVDWRRPTDAAAGADSGRFGIGVAYRRGRRWAIGGALRFLVGDPIVDRTTSLDLGVTWRPRPWITASVVAHDFLAPVGLGADDDVPGTFRLAAQVRPFSDDRLAIEALGAVDTDGRVGVGGIGSARIPSFGRLLAQIDVADLREDPELRVLAGLAIDMGRGRLEGGVVVGDGIDPLVGYGGVRLRGDRRSEGLPVGRVVHDVTVSSAGARGILSLLGTLDRDRLDGRVAGVLLRMRGSGLGLAHAQELREAIVALQEAGKPVACHLEAATGSEIYACSVADRVLMDPAGNVRLLGPSVTLMHYGEIFETLGIRADFVRIGRYKSAVEPYTNRAPTDPARAAWEARLDGIYERLLQDLARDHEVTRQRAERYVDEGPYSSWEAIDAGLVHEAADEHDLGRALRDTFDGRRHARELVRVAPEVTGVPRRIAVLVVDGALVDGNNVDYPIVEIHQSGGRTVSRAVEALAADPSVAAIVVRVDSPGGSVLASDQIWRALRRARRRKPVVASMGAIAASGGYYVACAADEIWADPSTLTGSIGIFFGKADFAQLGERIGVGLTTIGRGRRAGAASLYRPFTAEERAVLADKIRIWYRLFLQRIATTRDMTPVEIHRLGEGRVYTGDEARRLGLVDHLGGLRQALARARQLAALPDDAEVVVLPGRPSSLVDYVTGSLGLSQAATDLASVEDTAGASLPEGVRRLAELAAAMEGAAPETPLAMLPLAAPVE